MELHGFNTNLSTLSSAGPNLFLGGGLNEEAVSIALIRTLLTITGMNRILVAAQICGKRLRMTDTKRDIVLKRRFGQ